MKFKRAALLSAVILSGLSLNGCDSDIARKNPEVSEEAGAAYEQGLRYELGRGVAKDDRKAFEAYERAAGLGMPQACHNLANAYAAGRGVTQNTDEAKRWYGRAADQGLAESRYALAVILIEGPETQRDLTRGAALLEQAADQKLAEAQYRLARYYTKLVLKRPENRSTSELYQAAAEQGHPFACFEYGRGFQTGAAFTGNPNISTVWLLIASEKGVSQADLVLKRDFSINDPSVWSRDLATLKSEAEAGDRESCYFLGLAYLSGAKGLNKDAKSAYNMFLRSANLGYPPGEFALARSYGFETGMISPLDSDRNLHFARRWYTKAVNHQHNTARLLLAFTMLRPGDGYDSSNFPEAARLLKISADTGTPTAQLLLGFLYANGLGVDKNPTEAYARRIVARRLGVVQGGNVISAIGIDQSLDMADFHTGKHFEQTIPDSVKAEANVRAAAILATLPPELIERP